MCRGIAEAGQEEGWVGGFSRCAFLLFLSLVGFAGANSLYG